MKNTIKVLEQLRQQLGYNVTLEMLERANLDLGDFSTRPELFYFIDAALHYDKNPPGEKRIKSILEWVGYFKREKYRVFIHYLKFFPEPRLAWDFYSYFRISTLQGVQKLARWAKIFNLPSVADTAMRIFPSINLVPQDTNLLAAVFTAYELIKFYRIPYNKRKYHILVELAKLFKGKEEYMHLWFSYFRNLGLIRRWLRYVKPEDFELVKKLGKISPEDML